MRGSLFDRNFNHSPEAEEKMRDGNQVGDILHGLAELADNVTKQNPASYFENEKINSIASQIKRPFGRQKSVYNILGGGKSADVFLWRNKKISGSVLAGATTIWILFEWLNYNFLSMVCFGMALVMLGQFVWSNTSVLLTSRSRSEVPRLVLPEELFVNLGKTIGAEINRALGYLQDLSCGGNLKQFLVALVSLVAAAILGTWFNFLTVLYVGFVAAHTLPVLYEKYEDEVDSFVYNLLGQLQNRYQTFDARVLSRMPTRNFGKKHD